MTPRMENTARQESPEREVLRHVRVLLVEDDPVARLAAAGILSRYVGALWEAGDGDEGLQLFRQHQPDLVISDLVMPQRDGLSLARQIKQESPTTPIIITTSHSDSGALLDAIEIGVDRYVLKPLHAQALLDAAANCARTALLEAEHRLTTTVFRASSEAIMITDAENRIVDVNPAFTRITGYGRAEVVGRNPRLLQSGIQSEHFYREMWSAINQHGHWRGEIWNRRRNGELYPEWLAVDRVLSPDGAVLNYVAMWSDISERKEAEARIHYLAHYDALTDLPNRVLFNDRFTQALLHARRYSETVGLMFVDLDRFKVVNDTLGHRVGDELLKQVAERLRQCVREEDTVSRQGGDEFVVLVANLGMSAAAAVVADKILAALAEPIHFEGHELMVTCSVGIACYPGDGADPETLMKNADMAMYRAKSVGRNNYQFFSPELEQGALTRLTLENAMRRALDREPEREELELHYLPQVDNPSGRLLSLEALIRWRHPEQGLLLPAQFIPLAEESGLVLPLSLWVLRRVARQLAAWRRAGLPLVPVAINLCEAQLRQPDFAEALGRILADEGVEGRWIELEFTEAALMHDTERNLRVLSALKRLGVGITLDDFGVGYSNLNVLRRLPVDTLKIDRSLVSDVAHNEDDAVIVDAIISMARSMNLKVVAEGVETADQAGFFKARACAEIQGHFFSKAVGAEQVAALLGATAPIVAD
ncbi:MAG TPA: EAL domain-containing protein [Azospira sp.]|nr:EAL domain-containing protein [Azospira sp.]